MDKPTSMQNASQVDADYKLKLILQKKFSVLLSDKEFIECRQSLINLGKAISRWHRFNRKP